MLLPVSDNLNIGYLSRLFDNTSNCYKFFWFQAILRKLNKDNNRFSFDELVNEMIADAWYMVTEYHLRLGPIGVTDNLEEVVKYIGVIHPFPSSEKREKIIEFLQECDDKAVLKYKQTLTLNVPYRLQVPFYDEISINSKLWTGSKKILTDEINRQNRLMYYFERMNGLKTEIEISDIWAEYLVSNREILNGWLQLHLIHYLQNKNPSVPGIAEKIKPPIARDLERVRKYWRLIIKIDPSITDIYGHISLADEPISVDHFVPWQFVVHDELWNLHSTTREINSSKNDSLPAWKHYFEQLGNMEYRAYEMRQQYPQVSKAFETCSLYHLNNQEIRNQLYCIGLNRALFIERLEKVIEPVYESAKNCGFKEWVYAAKETI